MYTAFFRGDLVNTLPRPPPKVNQILNFYFGFLMREHQEPAISMRVQAVKLHRKGNFILAYEWASVKEGYNECLAIPK